MKNILVIVSSIMLTATLTLAIYLYDMINEQRDALEQTYIELQQLRYEISTTEKSVSDTSSINNF